MTPTPPVSNETSTPATGQLPRVPPDEQFWKRYSPHHEFPLSSVSSVAAHILVVVLLVLGAMVAGAWLRELDRPVPVEAVVVGGGGGSPGGVGEGPGVGPDAAPRESVPDPTQAKTSALTPPDITRPKLTAAQAEEIKVAFNNDPAVQRYIDEGNAAVETISQLSKDTRSKLAEGLAAGYGRGGPGSDGGRDRGKDKGTGNLTGGSQDKASIRQKRVLRWFMLFNTLDGNDYARQLSGLGAILAVPEPDGSGQYRVIRDLNQRPARGEIEDLAQIQRIYWVDDKPESVRSLAMALRLPGIPPHIVAFFPLELEQKLLQLELTYRGKREDEITETRFEVRRRRDGSYEPVVTSQK